MSSNKPHDSKVMSTHSVDVFHNNSVCPPGKFVELDTQDVKLSFQIDSGAEISLMSETQWTKLNSPALEKTDVVPVNFDGSHMISLGKLSIKFDSIETPLEFLVVRSSREHGLIGRDLIDASQSKLACTFASMCEYLPPIKGFTASMATVRDSAPLKFIKARKVPIHLKDQLVVDLARLQTLGVIEPISFSNHASPVVWVKKTDGTYRMSVDFKATVNESLLSDAYPIPPGEEVFAKIGK